MLKAMKELTLFIYTAPRYQNSKASDLKTQDDPEIQIHQKRKRPFTFLNKCLPPATYCPRTVFMKLIKN